MNAPNTDLYVSNENINTACSTSSTVVTNNSETMSSQILKPNNVTTVAELNILNQNNIEIIGVDYNSMTSNNESTIDALISLENTQQRVASYNAAQQSDQLTLNKGELTGDIQDLLSHLCVCETRKLLYNYFKNTQFTIYNT